MLMNEKKVDYKQGKQINVALTGMLEFSLAPPMRPSLWKFSGKTSLPNLRSWSLFHAISFLLTSKTWLSEENLNVSLNRLQAISPQGTITEPLDVVAWGLQNWPVLLSADFNLNCTSFRLLTYLRTYLRIVSWSRLIKMRTTLFFTIMEKNKVNILAMYWLVTKLKREL